VTRSKFTKKKDGLVVIKFDHFQRKVKASPSIFPTILMMQPHVSEDEGEGERLELEAFNSKGHPLSTSKIL